MKGILIDVTAQEVRPVAFESMEDMRALIGGHLELGYAFPRTLDMLYVDEEGLLKEPPGYFHIVGREDQLLAGNGLIVGRELPDSWKSYDPLISIERVRRMVTFFRRQGTYFMRG